MDFDQLTNIRVNVVDRENEREKSILHKETTFLAQYESVVGQIKPRPPSRLITGKH